MVEEGDQSRLLVVDELLELLIDDGLVVEGGGGKATHELGDLVRHQ